MEKKIMKVAICEANNKCQMEIKAYCDSYFSKKNIEVELCAYESGEEYLLKDFGDILIIGPHSKNIGAIFLKEILEYLHTSTRIVFISCDNICIEQAFGKNVYGFLRMPINEERFFSLLEKAVDDWLEESHYIYGRMGDRVERVNIRQVKYVEAKGRGTNAYIKGKEKPLMLKWKMQEWFESLKEIDFVVVHRCYIVNMIYISRIEDSIYLVDGDVIPMADTRKESIIAQYMRFKEINVRNRRGNIAHGEQRSCRTD